VHVQNMEQLHAYCYQNVIEHKTSGTVYETKSTDMHNTESGSG